MESAHQISALVALGAGLLSFISPCVLPLVPSYLSFITGMSAPALRDRAILRQQRYPIMLHALSFIAGFSLVFIALGASFSLLGSFLRAHLDLLQSIGGAVIIFFGLVLVGLFVNIRLTPHAHQKTRDFPKKADITIAYGKYTATTHLRL